MASSSVSELLDPPLYFVEDTQTVGIDAAVTTF
jgi:hypothetical protein